MDENEIIHSYKREQAIADGVLIDLTELATEAGFICPVAFIWRQGEYDDYLAGVFNA
jgi:hypothetical protein